MSRTFPYRGRLPIHILQLMDVASRITLFLVGNNGPLSFIFQDRLQNKYKTTIGSQIKCSCSPQKNDHCIHSIYVFLKIFKVKTDNPIIWQSSYLDNELQDLLQGKHSIKQKQNNKKCISNQIQQPNFQSFNFVNYLPSDFLKQKELFQKKNKQKKRKNVQQMPLSIDSLCPICQEQMTTDMNLTFCKTKCGNNYHLQCLKVWINHKQSQGIKITCPMCRVQFQSSITKQLEQEQFLFNKKIAQLKQKQYSCSGCGLQVIPKLVHKCLFCYEFQLCKSCYDLKKHLKHPFVLRREDGRWQGAEQRRPNQIKIKEFIENKRQKLENFKILGKLRKINQDPGKILDFVASSYPYVSKYISQNIDPYKNLDINESNMKCMKCGSKRMIFLRRLPCGHFIDHQCLKKNIIMQKFYCQQDGSQILKGYQSLLHHQKEENKFSANFIQHQFNPYNMEEFKQKKQFISEQKRFNPTLNQIFKNLMQDSRQKFFQNTAFQGQFSNKKTATIERPKKLSQKNIKKNNQQRKSTRQKQKNKQKVNLFQMKCIQEQKIKYQQDKKQSSRIRIRSINNQRKLSNQKNERRKINFGIQQLIKLKFQK